MTERTVRMQVRAGAIVESGVGGIGERGDGPVGERRVEHAGVHEGLNLVHGRTVGVFVRTVELRELETKCATGGGAVTLQAIGATWVGPRGGADLARFAAG